ncbi:hypothetical protein DL95DRAFT_464390 [Leptodontidium sp. 2 PMI_412]|nr:hypothetical protein DL95DRAFT_464390 [Leptodontidium sp. 2 PMI_412]
MHFQIIVLVYSALASVASARSVKANHLKPPYCPPKPVPQHRRRLIFEEFVQKLYVERKGTVALLDHMPEDYIQHSPSIVSGRNASIQALSVLAPENVNITMRHYGMDGDLAWVFTRYDFVGQA